eukprot:5379795-Pleurochrysis_carterae.AAC.1
MCTCGALALRSISSWILTRDGCRCPLSHLPGATRSLRAGAPQSPCPRLLRSHDALYSIYLCRLQPARTVDTLVDPSANQKS